MVLEEFGRETKSARLNNIKAKKQLIIIKNDHNALRISSYRLNKMRSSKAAGTPSGSATVSLNSFSSFS
jgi:hypothetical protein